MRYFAIVIGISAISFAPAMLAAKTVTPAASRHKVVEQRWAAQNLNGAVSIVDPNMHLLVVRDSSGVPFDITIARSTKIKAGKKREDLAQLSPKESVSIHYVPEARGDIARTVRVND